MELFEAIDNRKTIRKFDEYRPTTEEIKRIINSARLAPSAINIQNWKFIAIYNNEIKEKLAECVLNGYDLISSRVSDKTKAEIEKYKGHSTFFAKAPVLIVCVEEYAPVFMGDVLEEAGFNEKETSLMRPDAYLLSIGGAIENILLSAYGLSMGGCWMVAPVLGQSGMRNILKLDENAKIVSLVALGKPAADISDTRPPKKDLDEIMEIIE